MSWTRSDTISAIALVVSAIALGIQYSQVGLEARLQLFSARNDSEGKIVDSLEQLIHARQRVMVDLPWNIYQKEFALKLTPEQIIDNAKAARPILEPVGNFNGAMQAQLKYWNNPETLNAFAEVGAATEESMACFTQSGSFAHKVSQSEFIEIRQNLAKLCEGQNLPPSLVRLKNAEANAIEAMKKERAEGDKDLLPS